jgi:hypothetical protein
LVNIEYRDGEYYYVWDDYTEDAGDRDAHLVGNAWWYEDFPNLDLSILKEVGEGESDPDVDIDFLAFEWDGVYRDSVPVTTAYLVDSEGEVVPVGSTFSAIFIDSTRDTSGMTDAYTCTVSADVSSAVPIDPDGWTGWPSMAFGFDPTLVEWTTEGGACDDAAFMLGVTDPAEWLADFVWGFGYGPMNDTEFEDALAEAVGETDYADWAGNVGIGWLLTDITGETALNDVDYVVNAPLTEDDEVLIDGESWLEISTPGMGDASVAPDAYLSAQMFFGFGWGR